MHKVAPQIQSAPGIPLIHLADATAERIVAQGDRKYRLDGYQFHQFDTTAIHAEAAVTFALS